MKNLIWFFALAVWTALGTSATPTTENNLIVRQNPVTRESTAASSTFSTTSPSPTIPSSTVPALPAESTGCVLHIDRYHCEGNASGENSETSSELSDQCVQHGSHFHCPAGVEPTCDATLEDYNLPLHVMALFVLLASSAIGAFGPLVLGKFASGRSSNGFWSYAILCMKHFGTGVIISTAFIHLLLHSFILFASECIGTLAYEAIGPAIAMGSLLVLFAFNLFAARAIAARRNRNAQDKALTSTNNSFLVEQNKLNLWEIEVLEAGIVFHSVMIGITLGAQGGSGFIPTFCAIVFHQLFEGFGLGARLALLKGYSMRKFLLALAYTLITPVGIAIGIGVRSSYNVQEPSVLLATGTLNAVSAGVLLWAGIAQLLVGDWLVGPMLGGCPHPGEVDSKNVNSQSGPLRDAPMRILIPAGVSLILGVIGMSVIGKWA